MSDDWAMKGCHVHVGKVEVSIHPNHLGGVLFRTPFSSTPTVELDAAITVVRSWLNDTSFRQRLLAAIERAAEHMPSIEGFWSTRANGRLKEFKFLILALQREPVL